ncbi:hypothetical protein BD410DRAFT_896768 [Rickenella mellea]|uniref:Uncharacterized protein n=1 Tax=Rickenella mellea TaxID=50990 RepID=A0A4Y7QB28_9AGAM|nr:hypothetical protein BD410DRAFT_896768 [Rickenella mellea]
MAGWTVSLGIPQSFQEGVSHTSCAFVLSPPTSCSSCTCCTYPLVKSTLVSKSRSLAMVSRLSGQVDTIAQSTLHADYRRSPPLSLSAIRGVHLSETSFVILLDVAVVVVALATIFGVYTLIKRTKSRRLLQNPRRFPPSTPDLESNLKGMTDITIEDVVTRPVSPRTSQKETRGLANTISLADYCVPIPSEGTSTTLGSTSSSGQSITAILGTFPVPPSAHLTESHSKFYPPSRSTPMHQSIISAPSPRFTPPRSEVLTTVFSEARASISCEALRAAHILKTVNILVGKTRHSVHEQRPASWSAFAFDPYFTRTYQHGRLTAQMSLPELATTK